MRTYIYNGIDTYKKRNVAMFIMYKPIFLYVFILAFAKIAIFFIQMGSKTQFFRGCMYYFYQKINFDYVNKN